MRSKKIKRSSRQQRRKLSPKRRSKKRGDGQGEKRKREETSEREEKKQKTTKSCMIDSLDATIITINPGKLLYHGTTKKFDPKTIMSKSNFGSSPFAPSSVRRWAQCQQFIPGDILVYEVEHPIDLLDIDDSTEIDDKTSMIYFTKLMNALKLNRAKGQDELKLQICSNDNTCLNEIKIHGYKWEKHEKEYVICKPMSFLRYVGKISCSMVNELGKEFWDKNPTKEQLEGKFDI